MIIWNYSVFSCHLFLISSASVRSLSILFFIMLVLAWNVPLISSVFLRRGLVFALLLFSFVSLHCSFKEVLSLLAVVWNSAFSWLYLSLSPLHFSSLLSSAICKASLDNHFDFFHFFFFGIVLVTAPCTVLQTSIHCSSHTLSTRSNPLNLFVTSTEHNVRNLI